MAAAIMPTADRRSRGTTAALLEPKSLRMIKGPIFADARPQHHGRAAGGHATNSTVFRRATQIVYLLDPNGSFPPRAHYVFHVFLCLSTFFGFCCCFSVFLCLFMFLRFPFLFYVFHVCYAFLCFTTFSMCFYVFYVFYFLMFFNVVLCSSTFDCIFCFFHVFICFLCFLCFSISFYVSCFSMSFYVLFILFYVFIFSYISTCFDVVICFYVCCLGLLHRQT